METQIMKVLEQGEIQRIESRKAENGQLSKCTIILQKLGGKYEDTFQATLLGNLAECRFYPRDLVAVSLRFSVREYQDSKFQDVIVNDIVKL